MDFHQKTIAFVVASLFLTLVGSLVLSSSHLGSALAGLVCLVVKTGGPKDSRAVRLNVSPHELVEPYRPTEVGHGSNHTGSCQIWEDLQTPNRVGQQKPFGLKHTPYELESDRVTCHGIGLCESSPEIKQSQLS